MRLLPYLCISLFFFQSCHQQNLGDENFYFHPDSSKTYSIILIKQETSSWQYNKEETETTSEKISINLKLIRVVDSLYQLKLTFGDFRISRPPATITLNGITKTYQLDSIPSKKGIKDNYFQLSYYWLGLTKGLSEYIWMNKKGEVLQVQGFDKLSDSVAVLSGSKKEDVKYSLTNNVGEKIISDNFNQLFSIAPNHKENIGDSWVRNIILVDNAPVKLSDMYIINKIEGDSLFVHVTSSISGWAGSNATTPFMEGQGDGEIIISKSTGVPYSYQLNSATKTKTDRYITTGSGKFSATVQ